MNLTKENNIETFRNNLKFYRKKRGFSLSELSKLTGLSMRMLSYYELYATNIPIDKIDIIAKALNISINELLGNKVDTKKNKELIDIDTRTLQKIKNLLSLPAQDRAIIYSMINNLVEMRKFKKKKQQQKQDANK